METREAFENLEERDDIQDGTEEMGSESVNVQISVNRAVAPCKGMEFSNMAEAYDFYYRYAKARGFGIQRDSSSYSRKLNVVCRKVYVCDKEGAKRTYDAKQKERVITRRAETQCHCRARMAIALSDSGKWIVKQFEDDHTHELSAHSKVRKKRSHNQLILGLENSVQTSPDCGPEPPMDSQVSSHSSGDLQTIDGSHQASQGHVGQGQKNYVKHHCMKIVEYLQHKSSVEDGFFFKAEVDSDNQVKNVFWAD